jgi:hypothetical protein
MEAAMKQDKESTTIAKALQTGHSSPDAEDGLFDLSEVDAGITYPSYKSFDEYIDVERLRSLDRYIAQRIRRHIQIGTDLKFYTGPYKFGEQVSDRPGSRMIYLAESTLPDSYFDLDRTDVWRPSPAAEEFTLLMEFIRTLPFKATGRMLIMYDDVPREVPAHRDHVETEILHDFIWFRSNLKKPFYMLDQHTGEKAYVETYSAWFDTVNQYHGSDPCDGLTFSIRVDGVFTDEFKSSIPSPSINKASTPSYWAYRTREVNEQGIKNIC